jgi:uncharacterized protein (DUF1501 family)
MKLTRRRFVQGASAGSLLASTHVLAFAARTARAAGIGAPILVLVNLRGGNDSLNTVIPLDNVGAPQRSEYDSLRPTLGIAPGQLAATEIAPDPILGTGMAFHPLLDELWTLYDEGKVAVINGIGMVGNSLSHFEAERVWYNGDGSPLATTGWIGRHQDQEFGDGQVRAISFSSSVNQTLAAEVNMGIGVRDLDRFTLPDDGERRYRDVDARKAAWATIFGEDRGASLAGGVAGSGDNLVQMSDLLSSIEVSGWGSNNENENFGLGEDLRQVASILRHDEVNPGSATGFCFFHCGTGGFDTHSRQGSLDPNAGHGRLMDRLSRTLFNFQRDVEGLGVADRVVTVCYSEFGRRVFQNANGNNAGTDHGLGGIAFAIGTGVNGGHYGGCGDLRAVTRGNLDVMVDFRSLYAALIEDWLGGSQSVLPGAPYTKLPIIA